MALKELPGPYSKGTKKLKNKKLKKILDPNISHSPVNKGSKCS